MPMAVRKFCQMGGFLLLISTLFLMLSVVSYSYDDPAWNYYLSQERTDVHNLGGMLGAVVADWVLQALGSAVFVLLGTALILACCVMLGRLMATLTIFWRGMLLLAAVSAGSHLALTRDPVFGVDVLVGGIVGQWSAKLLVHYLNLFGAYMCIIAAAVLALFVGTDYHFARRVILPGYGLVSRFAGYLVYAGCWVQRLICCKPRINPRMSRIGLSTLTLRRSMPSTGHSVAVGNTSGEQVASDVILHAASAPVAIDGVLPDGADDVSLEVDDPAVPEDVPHEFYEPPSEPGNRPSSEEPEERVGIAPRPPLPRSRQVARPRKRGAKDLLPSLDLLDPSAHGSHDQHPDTLREQAQFLEAKLRDFGVEGEVVQVLPGPVITMYEFAPAPGVKVSKIVNLQDDLALVMRALSVRVVAPIPGKAVVGIEIPNRKRATVGLRELLDSDEFRGSKSKLSFALGEDILGKPVITDLALIPHLLIAGATGSGKSVGLNSMICSLLFRSTPADVRMIMIDPKMLELSIYDGIPHLLIPVVTNPKKAAVALRRVVEEMERRYHLLASQGVRSIAQYNQRVEEGKIQLPEDDELDDTSAEGVLAGVEKLPYLVVVIDELSDLMMVSSRDVEDALTRIAQMARAAGIHLIVATQRPSVDVLTGVIKANFPARVSFQVSSKTDSRTILDANGAEKLLGRGDMLFLAPGTSKPQRIHGAYVSEAEINRLVESWKRVELPHYDDSFMSPNEETVEVDDEEYDEKYDEALALVTRTGQASISMLQRRLRVGYNRAARMIEIMEREGVIGPADGVKPREVLVRPEYDEV